MRTTLLSLLFLFITSLHAQLTAGEIPPGSITYFPGVALSLGSADASDTADIELDCDDFMDLQAVLHRGAPELDSPNLAMLHFVDTDIEVCMDVASGFQQRPRYYSFGEALECTGSFNWQAADQLTLGDFGGFFAIGPLVIDSMYLAFRRGSEIGWMLLSFEVGGPTLELQVHEILPLCQTTTSIDEAGSDAKPVIHPNPSNGESIEVRSAEPLHSIEVLDAAGRMVAQYAGTVRSIAAPDVAGVYCVRTLNADGRRNVARLVRY